QGLLGAEAFVGDSDRLRHLAAVVNVEARGTSGPSLLFELSSGSSRLVAAAARALPRPVTNSILYTLYQRLPNDTDLTVFKRVGLAGVNFAFVGWPQGWTLPLALLAALLVLAAALLSRWSRGSAGGGWGALAALTSVALATVVAFAAVALLRRGGGLPYTWVAHVWPLRLIFFG